MRNMSSRIARALAVAQGAYHFATGVWPLFSIDTSQKATGPKRDVWLVKTAGVLVSVIGDALMVAGWRQTAPEISLLAVGSAADLAAVEVVYAGRGRISTLYLLDAAVEAVIVADWLLPRPTTFTGDTLLTGWESRPSQGSPLTKLADEAVDEMNSLRGHAPIA